MSKGDEVRDALTLGVRSWLALLTAEEPGIPNMESLESPLVCGNTGRGLWVEAGPAARRWWCRLCRVVEQAGSRKSLDTSGRSDRSADAPIEAVKERQ